MSDYWGTDNTVPSPPFHYGEAGSIHYGSWGTTGCPTCNPTLQAAPRYCPNCGARQ